MLTHCCSKESRNALRRKQVLAAGWIMELRQLLNAPRRSQDAQLLHDVLPGPENWPVSHALQDDAPAVEKVPLGHMAQPIPWPRVKNPAGHGSQEEAEGPDEVPGGQTKQVSERPPLGLNVLMEHSEHVNVGLPAESMKA